jgi:hypothetical protein
MGYEPAHAQRPITADESDALSTTTSPAVSLAFKGHVDGRWVSLPLASRPKHTDHLIFATHRREWTHSVLAKTFPVVWDQPLDHVSKKTDEDGGEAALETQDRY